MTTNQTIDGVPRELLTDVLKIAGRACKSAWSAGVCDELRALLDAERCTSCDDSGDLIDLTGEWRGYCVCPAGVSLKSRPAGQPPGEPVYFANEKELAGGTEMPTVDRHKTAYCAVPLYAEQPALEAVVLPERKAARSHNSHDWDEGYSDGWKAYDDELKLLNPSL